MKCLGSSVEDCHLYCFDDMSRKDHLTINADFPFFVNSSFKRSEF